MLLEEKLEAQFDAQREEIARLKREYGRHVISDVTVAQLDGGARGVTSVVCDTSEVDPIKGLIIRGRPVKELAGISAEECFWLLLTGELPTHEEEQELVTTLGYIRNNVWDKLSGLKDIVFRDAHPVVATCLALQYLQRWSRFKRNDQQPKAGLWRWALQDALTIFAVLPESIALLFGNAPGLRESLEHSWSSRLGHAITERGRKALAYESSNTSPNATLEPSPLNLSPLMRLYVLVHCDHEGSNACALACRTAASTLADPYLALTAGWRALAGPIHGLASQVCIEFIDELRAKLGDEPSDVALAAEVQARIASGKVIPGFGHAVLRAMDPRYELLHAFGMANFPGDPAIRIADGLLRVVPPLLQATGKVANPWPNVDGISGAIMKHYGLTDYRWLTVLFAACMSLGLLAQMVISRGLGEPIVHPKAITPELLRLKLSGSR
jgi:citrate synthase